MAAAAEDQALQAIADAVLSEEHWDWDTPWPHQMAEYPDVHPWKIELSGLDDSGGITIVASFNGEVRRAEFTKDRVNRVTQYWEGPEETADGTPIKPGITTPLAIKILAKEVRSVAQNQSQGNSLIAGLSNTVTSGLEYISNSITTLARTINTLLTKIGVQGQGIQDNGAGIQALREELQAERAENAKFRVQCQKMFKKFKIQNSKFVVFTSYCFCAYPNCFKPMGTLWRV